jgi:Right handed beta helix region
VTVRSRLAGIAAAVGLGVALLALLPSAASAQPVACGQVITEDTRLDSDLSCIGSGPALTIGADGVELDLQGHRVAIGDIGVLNEGHDRVTITNGALHGEPYGLPLLLRGADYNRISDVQAGSAGGPAVWLEDSDHNRIERSSLGAELGGVTVREGSDHNLITRNTLYAGLGWGLSIRESDGNVASRNFFDYAAEIAEASLIVGAGADDTILRRNLIEANWDKDGVWIEAETTGTLLERNEVRRSPGDGIQVDSPFTTLTRNVSYDNGGWGILAVAGVIDGGGNAAFSNAAGQCLNVAC